MFGNILNYTCVPLSLWLNNLSVCFVVSSWNWPFNFRRWECIMSCIKACSHKIIARDFFLDFCHSSDKRLEYTDGLHPRNYLHVSSHVRNREWHVCHMTTSNLQVKTHRKAHPIQEVRYIFLHIYISIPLITVTKGPHTMATPPPPPLKKKWRKNLPTYFNTYYFITSFVFGYHFDIVKYFLATGLYCLQLHPAARVTQPAHLLGDHHVSSKGCVCKHNVLYPLKHALRGETFVFICPLYWHGILGLV